MRLGNMTTHSVADTSHGAEEGRDPSCHAGVGEVVDRTVAVEKLLLKSSRYENKIIWSLNLDVFF